jgi:hypothetical protein
MQIQQVDDLAVIDQFRGSVFDQIVSTTREHLSSYNPRCKWMCFALNGVPFIAPSIEEGTHIVTSLFHGYPIKADRVLASLLITCWGVEDATMFYRLNEELEQWCHSTHKALNKTIRDYCSLIGDSQTPLILERDMED